MSTNAMMDTIKRVKRRTWPETLKREIVAAFLPAIGVEVPDREVQCRAAVASTLVAGLELAKAGRVGLGQAEVWGEISVSLVVRETPIDTVRSF